MNNISAGSSVYDVVHWFSIKVIDEKRKVVEFVCWDGLKWQLRLKYDWYFKYRAALLQVKYPRLEVNCYWGNEPATGKTLEEIRLDKIRAKKSKITQYRNKLEKAKANWTSLFAIEDDVDYQRAVEKIKRLEFELRAL
ncbi:hypothetical protein [Lacihabitans soyangensis]|uniref:Uncharacterized protein n=1 Tax=Lacihabitans soyangensis TaxID=869394 RepID=A0AAE3H2Y5_9BACT|nr:hypothetical protein [Lacihabitans soyangensis]MCP9763818.1 hypothetical protein [Lacihabitans soyangensis]